MLFLVLMKMPLSDQAANKPIWITLWPMLLRIVAPRPRILLISCQTLEWFQNSPRGLQALFSWYIGSCSETLQTLAMQHLVLSQSTFRLRHHRVRFCILQMVRRCRLLLLQKRSANSRLNSRLTTSEVTRVEIGHSLSLSLSSSKSHVNLVLA
jgi:hypothetical protein